MKSRFFELVKILSPSTAKVQRYLFTLNTLHSYNFSRSSSHIRGVSSTLASPCRFSSTHLAPKTLLTSVNSESFIISKPRVDLKSLLSPLVLFSVLLE